MSSPSSKATVLLDVVSSFMTSFNLIASYRHSDTVSLGLGLQRMNFKEISSRQQHIKSYVPSALFLLRLASSVSMGHLLQLMS